MEQVTLRTKLLKDFSRQQLMITVVEKDRNLCWGQKLVNFTKMRAEGGWGGRNDVFTAEGGGQTESIQCMPRQGCPGIQHTAADTSPGSNFLLLQPEGNGILL